MNVLFKVLKVNDEQYYRIMSRIRWIYKYAVKYWKEMFFYVFIGVFGTIISLLSGVISKNLIDIITNQRTGVVIQTFCIMIGLNIGTTVVSQISIYFSNKINMKVNAEIKTDIFSKILMTDWESLTKYHTGDLLTRWSADVSNVSSGVLNFFPNLCICSFRFISALAMVIYYDWTFVIFTLVSFPLNMILSRTLMKRMVKNNEQSAAIGARMSGFNQETFSNIQTIKAFDLSGFYINKLKSFQKEFINMKLEYQKMSMKTSFLITLISMIASYAAYGWGIYRVFSGEITYGTMTLFLSLSGTLTSSVNNLSSTIPMLISLTTSAGRLMDIVEMPREDYSNDDVVAKFLEVNKAQGISLKMKDVDYAYKTGTLVFESASMEVNPHEIIALVGPSGEGKTTMLRLVLSLMQTQEGAAYLTGEHVYSDLFNEETKSLDCEELFEKYNAVALTPSTRKLFSYVPQGNTMFSGTIAENMRNVKDDATDEQIIEALKAACAWEFVEKLPDGINSAIKERGGGFSEGQAQRLSIARALLRDAPILLLDEATSALDVATERKVLRNIMNDERPRTCIVTTHRPTVLSACTRVYAIREKKCVVLKEEEIDELVRGF